MLSRGASHASVLVSSLRTAFRSAVQHARVQRGRAARHDFRSAGRARYSGASGAASESAAFEEMLQRRGFNPSSMDFAPKLKFNTSKWCPKPKSQEQQAFTKCKVPHPTEPCPEGIQQRTRMLLLEAYMCPSLRKKPHTCPAHGRARWTPNIGGNGGGRNRIACGIWRSRQGHDHHHYRQYRQRYSHYYRRRFTAGPHAYHRRDSMRRLVIAGLHRKASAGCKHAPAVASGSCNALLRAAVPLVPPSPPQQPNAPSAPCFSFQKPPASRPLRLPRTSTLGITVPQFSSSPFPLAFTCQPRPPALLSARAFHSSPSRRGYAHAAELVIKVATHLKSAHALSMINLIFRFSVTFIPLSLKRAAWLRKARLASIAGTGAAAAASVGGSSIWSSALVKYGLRGALALPFVMLAAVLVASLERTPITGRWRLLLLNEKEEQDIVNRVFEVGATPVSEPAVARAQAGAAGGGVATGAARDWLTIMRAVLGEEDTPEGTLLGGKVLDSRTDWRARLVEDILDKLETNLPNLAHVDDSAMLPSRAGATADGPNTSILPPPLRYPLASSGRTVHLSRRNSVLVIERPESNAFSFGFYGCVDEPQPGVIIVFTGAIDEIMKAGGAKEHMGPLELQAAQAKAYEQHAGVLAATKEEEPSWLRAFFGSIVPTSATPVPMLNNASQVVVPVSKEQEEALAVLLAHELAHLVLSHTIESYASTTLLWPQLEKLGWDMLRVFIYPVTALLGPFVQDAISATVKVGMEESGGLLPALTSSCESRQMEHEADIVALRLLANAGIDPRSSIDFWEERLIRGDDASSHSHVLHHADSATPGHRFSHGSYAHAHLKEVDSFIRTHPADQERIAAIRRELARWQTITV